jgi:lysophospholipase L1-like esterase
MGLDKAAYALAKAAIAAIESLVAGAVPDKSITLAKMNDMATGSLIYRKTAGTGVPEVQAIATLKTDLGLTGTNSGDQNAAGVAIADAGNIITATTVEAALQEVATKAIAAVPATLVGASSGVCPLDSGSKVSATYLPSYVDDVLEYATVSAFPATGESGKLYVVTSGADINKTYRWSGTVYIEIVASPGTTDAITEGTTNLYFTAARVGSSIFGAAAKTTLADADTIALTDSAAGNALKKITVANLKTAVGGSGGGGTYDPPAPFSLCSVSAKPNSNNNTQIQVDFVFDISGKGLVNGDAFTFSADVQSNDSNVSQLNSQYICGTNSTASDFSGQTGSINQTSFVPWSGPAQTYSYTGTVPSTSGYMHCFLNVKVTNNTLTTLFDISNVKLLLKGTSYTVSGDSGLYNKNANDIYSPKQYLGQRIGTTINNLYGKSIDLLGDSVTSGNVVGWGNTWGYKLGSRNNMTINNYGISGDTMGQMAARYASMSVADYIVVMGGINDFVQGRALGADTDNTIDSSFKGTLNVLCSGLITTFPRARILFVTPYNFNAAAVNGNHVSDFVAAIQTICAKYSIPVLDIYHNGGFNPQNTAQAAVYMADSLHPSIEGHAKLSTQIESTLNGL